MTPDEKSHSDGTPNSVRLLAEKIVGGCLRNSDCTEENLIDWTESLLSSAKKQWEEEWRNNASK